MPRPSLNYDAQTALTELRMKLSDVAMAVDNLSAQSLEGLAVAVREAGTEDKNSLMLALADAIDRRLEILSRHRDGRGTWFAVIEATNWDESRKSGEITTVAYEQCQGKNAAIGAARRLLAKHAKRFDDGVSIEPSVYCELEWDRDLNEPRIFEF